MITPYGSYDFIKTSKSWIDARAHCHQNRGHLVAFESEAEYEAVKGFIDVPYTYIGLNDRQTEGRYVWEHNGQLAGNYSPWPDNELQQAAHEKEQEDCIIVMPPGAWADLICAWPMPFMCEYP